MENEIWYLSNEFNKLPARDILKSIIRDDRKNYERAESELGDDIKLLDDAIVLYMESLKAAYQHIDEWKENDSNRAVMAMLISTLNYILLARHGILLGYYPEVQDLLRSCYERISRCYVFFHSETFARKFLEGKQINQSTINKEISKIEEDISKRDKLFDSLRGYYSFMSEVAHPNLKSFEARYGEKDLGERVGLATLIGGLMGSQYGHVAILRLLQTVLSTLKVVGVIIHEESGRWDREYQIIEEKCSQLIKNLSIGDMKSNNEIGKTTKNE